MLFYEHPEISWNEWFYTAMIKNNCLTPLAQYIMQFCNDSCFIDVPCGNASLHSEYSLYDLALQFNIKMYIEVDNNPDILGNRLLTSPRKYNNLSISTHCADILDFVRKWEKPQTNMNTIWYISGLQPNIQNITANSTVAASQYIETLFTALQKATVTNDIVIINDPETLSLGIDALQQMHCDARIALPAKGFLPSRSCPFGKVHVFVRT